MIRRADHTYFTIGNSPGERGLLVSTLGLSIKIGAIALTRVHGASI